MRTLYFDCFAGASGNMILAALIGLGVGKDQLETEIDKLNLPNVSLESKVVDRSGISALHVEVTAPDQKDHRHLSDIVKIIDASDLSKRVKSRAIAIFSRLADAEATVHGISDEKVHFHEVGAIDAIVDIVGACVGFEMLRIDRFVCSKINVGSGFVEMDHGKFPVPPPAVAGLLSEAPIYSNGIIGELITPTGAAIISTVCDSYGSLPEMKLERTAYGAGTRSYDRFPNVLRLLVGETENSRTDSLRTDNLILIETNLDDISPQVLGFVMERVFDLGALDCWFTPIQMKKNRPATMLSVLCSEAKRTQISESLYLETTTLGLRIRSVERECLEREFIKVNTRFGEVDVKIARYNGTVTNAMPEYEQVRRIAIDNKVSLQTVHDEVLTELKRISRASAA
jgi:pyridinium-3,5-bisthiocarboxylic acid mononucleotide nickel chelatase